MADKKGHENDYNPPPKASVGSAVQQRAGQTKPEIIRAAAKRLSKKNGRKGPNPHGLGNLLAQENRSAGYGPPGKKPY